MVLTSTKQVNITVRFDRHGPNAQHYRERLLQRTAEIRAERTPSGAKP